MKSLHTNSSGPSRLVTYWDKAAWASGVAIGGRLVPLDAIRGDFDHGRPTVKELLSTGPDHTAAVCAAAYGRVASGESLPLYSVALGPPLPDPDKIIGLGLNYREHASEIGRDAPETPTLFAKFRNSLVGPHAPIVLPAVSRQIDYEGELAVVIGSRCKAVDEQDAMHYVGGYAVLNDVTARDVQRRTSQWLAGKAMDTFAPMGPGIVPAFEVADPHALELITRLNGKVVQQASTSDMIFSIAAAISFISTIMSLEPGDIIATGTPGGVGSAQSPPRFLAPGDRVEVEIEAIGAIANPVLAESDEQSERTVASSAMGDGIG